jgi:hypothetical protein
MPEDRRRFDREILNEIKEVKSMVHEIQVDRAILKTQVDLLMKETDETKAHTRICSLEQSRKVWRAVVLAVPSFGGLLFAALKLL